MWTSAEIFVENSTSEMPPPRKLKKDEKLRVFKTRNESGGI
jgi:hypothetical protein